MFESPFVAAEKRDAPWAFGGLDDVDLLDLIPPVPADLLWAWNPVLDAEAELLHESALAMMSPADRFETEYGVPATPEHYSVEASTTEEAAIAMQDLALQATRMHRIAESHRISALLAAYESSIEDLEVRFGRDIGNRGGLGAQTFFKSMALLTGTHPLRVAHEVDIAATLRDRLPLTWSAFLRGDSSWARVDTAAQEADGLDNEYWAAFDAKAATAVVGSTRLRDDLRKTRERLQDGTAAKRARRTHERRRTTLELGADGGVAFIAEGLAAEWLPINDGLHRAAVAAHGLAGETRSLAVLRHDIALDLLREGLRRSADPTMPNLRVPDRKPVDVSLVLTVPALAWLGRTTEQAQLGGYGPIDMETAKGLAGSAKSFLRVLTDPVTGVRLTMDRKTYAPPADLARWVRIRDGRSRFPGSNRAAHLSDIDHAREWQDGGPTNASNLVTLDRPNHNLKSAGLVQEELLDSGIAGWTDAWGHYFEDPPADPLDPVPGGLLPSSSPPPNRDQSCPF